MRETKVEYLSSIVSTLNQTYGVDLTEKDRVRVDEIIREVEADAGVRAVMAGNNSIGNKRHKVHRVIAEVSRVLLNAKWEITDTRIARGVRERGMLPDGDLSEDEIARIVVEMTGPSSDGSGA